MGTVTIAATYGAGGSVIAPALAARLGLPFIERAIPIDVAKNINASMEEMLADDVEYTSRAGCVLERIMATLWRRPSSPSSRPTTASMPTPTGGPDSGDPLVA